MIEPIIFRRAFEESLRAQLLLNANAVVVSVSVGYLNAIGCSREQVLGRSMFELPPYERARQDCSQLHDALGLIARTRVQRSFSLEREPGGSVAANWTGVSIQPLLDAGGAASLFVHTFERELPPTVERTASDSERRLGKLIEYAYDAVVLRDAYGRVTYASPSIERVLGFTREEFAALTPLTTIHPDDMPLFAEKTKKLSATPGSVMVTQMRARHRDGSFRVLEMNAINRLHDPDIAAIMSTFRDVTQRVELEQQLRNSNDRLRVALSAARAISWDRALNTQRVEFLSDYRPFFGVSEGDGRILDHEKVVHPDDLQEVEQASRHSQRTGEDLQIEFRGPDRHGSPRWYAAYGKVIRDDAGRSVRMTGVTLDITERRGMQAEREQLDQRVQESQKLESLGVLAGGIAHDFNNILMAILGNASLTRLEVESNPTALSQVEQIEEAARRAAELCRQMLAYAGKGRFVLERTDVNRVIEETMHLLHVSISKKAVLRFNLYPNLPVVVADLTQLRQVLMNLVINASDAIGERSGVISISTGVVRADRTYLDKTFLAPDIAEGDYVYMEVSDTGCGMSQETQARIFEPFFSTKFTGRGLGLAAVLGIVRGHKGALKVYSELGKGSSFKLLLPANYEADKQVEKRAATQPEPFGKGTILVIDDEETVRAVTSHMLEVMGFSTLSAVDGREAVALYRERSAEITCVLLDLTMPHLDGEETFRELRRINPDVRVLLMSGYNEQDAIGRFVGKGLAGFVQKPFTLDELRQQLFALLG